MYTLILVDDEPWALSRLAGVIPWQARGFQVLHTCQSGEEALELIRKDRPDGVITDIRMEGMSGIQLIRHVREEKMPVEFIITSAHSDFEVARDAIVYNACHYLLKPLEREEVEQAAALLFRRLSTRDNATLHMLDPQNASNMNSDETRSLLDAAAAYPACCVMLRASAGPDMPALPSASVTAVQVKGCSGVSLLSFKGQIAESLGTLRHWAEREGVAIGVSLIHCNFDDLPLMLQEAQISLTNGLNYSAHPAVADIQFYLGINFASPLTLGDIAGRFFLSEAYLCELFKKHANITVISLIRELRLNRAAYLLLSTTTDVKRVAEEVGYQDYSYFGRMFKRKFGVPPEVYRKT